MPLSALCKLLLLSVWLGCMGWLLRFEAYPEWFTGDALGYKTLSKQMPALRDSWMKLSYDGQHVGYSHSSVEMEEVDQEEQLLLRNTLFLRVWMPNGIESMKFESSVLLDSHHELAEAEMSFHLGEMSGELTLTPAEDKGLYQAFAEFNGMKLSREVAIPSDSVLSSPVLEMGLSDMKPGKTIPLKLANPMGGESTRVELVGMERERWPAPEEGGRDLDVTRVELRMEELKLSAWVDSFGRVLRQETPFGILMEAGKPDEVIRVPEEQGVQPLDLIRQGGLGNFNPFGNLP